MPVFRTVVVENEPDVERRLLAFGASPSQFERIGEVARAWADDTSPLMPLNAPGTLAYFYGVQELRQQLLGPDWEVDRSCGIEAVINRKLGIRIAYQNVDRACDLIWKPHPRTAKGGGAEELSGPTLFEFAGIEPGPLSYVKLDGVSTYYVMVAEDGCVELTCPIIENGSYIGFVERIFIKRPQDEMGTEREEDSSPMDDFDVPVSLKDEA